MLIGDRCWSWYLRLPGLRGHPLSGVVRCELPAAGSVAAAVERADVVSACLPRFASQAHKEPRAPQNLVPIAGLEQRLRHLLGDPDRAGAGAGVRPRVERQRVATAVERDAVPAAVALVEHEAGGGGPGVELVDGRPAALQAGADDEPAAGREVAGARGDDRCPGRRLGEREDVAGHHDDVEAPVERQRGEVGQHPGEVGAAPLGSLEHSGSASTPRSMPPGQLDGDRPVPQPASSTDVGASDAVGLAMDPIAREPRLVLVEVDLLAPAAPCGRRHGPRPARDLLRHAHPPGRARGSSSTSRASMRATTHW